MRPIVILVVFLSVVCSPGAILHAQSCIAPDRLAGLSVTGTTCVEEGTWGDNWRCEPGDTITFTPLLRFGNTPATCPTPVDWTFGDGTTLSSSDPSVTHTYTRTGRFFGKVNAKFHGEGLRDFSIWAASGTIDFVSHSLTLGEGTTVAVAIERTGNLSRPGTVDYRTTGPILPLSGTLAFGAGEASKDLLISAPDDALWNGESQHAQIILSNPTEDWVFAPNYAYQATVTVLENDLAAIHQCTQTELHAHESDKVVTFELTRSQNTSVTTTGYVSISSGGDFFLPPYFSLATFAPGETTRLVEVRWEDNSVYHGTREWKFTCGGQQPGASLSKSNGTLTITDDEPYPTLISPPSLEVTETDTLQLFAIPLTFVPPFGHFVFPEVVLEHETSSATDLKLLPLRYPYDKIELEINGDDLPEPDESLYVRFTDPVQKWIPLTIRDDDRPLFPFTFDRASYEFDEALGGSVVVQRTGSLSSPVQLLLEIHTAGPGVPVERIPVLLASGEASKEVPLLLDDAYFTGTRQITLKLELDGFVGATASLSVKDDETIPSLSVGDESVREGNADQYPILVFRVTLSTPVGIPLHLSLAPSHVSTDAADFRAIPQPVIIPPGELTAIAEFVVNGDTTPEADETFHVTIASCCDGLATVARPTGTGTIVNDDAVPPPPPPPTETLYHLALGATSFKEADRWLSIPVHRSGIISGTTHATLKLTASDERVFAPRTVSFAPNETVNDVQFYINDFMYSGNTTVNVELFDDDRLLETKSVTILDDEAKPVTYFFGGSGREGNARNAVALRLSVSPPSRKPIILRLHSRSGDSYRAAAMFGQDFPPFDKTVEIPPGTYDYEVLVPIYNDQIKEDTESFYVDVTVDGAEIPSQTVWIADDESAYLEYKPYVARDTLTTISVHFPTPAPSNDAVIFVADPATLEGPLTVPVPAGATSVSFQVLPKRSGDASFAVEPPSFLRTSRLAAITRIFDEHTITLAPAVLELAPGTSARVEVMVGPGPAGFYTRLSDWTIAAFEAPVNTYSYPWFVVYGLAPGQTEILVELPASAGGGTARLPVVVKEPEEPVTGRKRSARH